MPSKKFSLYSKVSSENPKFQQFLGKPQMSYSAYTSWSNPKYRGEFIAQKFLGLKLPSGIFASYGTAAGEWLELNGEMPEDQYSIECREMLSDSDIAFLKGIEREPGSEFEREIMVDRGTYCILGYIDKTFPLDDGSLHVRDFKTGSKAKAKEYASDDYQQTNLYSYALESEGEVVGGCDVQLLHRKGNTTVKDHKNVLRLEGSSELVPTPYTKERAEKFLKKMDKVAIEISDRKAFFTKYFPDHGAKN